MKNNDLKVKVLLTTAKLYKDKMPELPEEYSTYWKSIISDLVEEECQLSFSTVYTENKFSDNVTQSENEDTDLLIILPMSYSPSELARTLITTKLPLAILSTAKDLKLPDNMTGTDLLANQAVHGVIDLTNFLWRENRIFHMISGHPEQIQFKVQFNNLLKVAKSAKTLRKGKCGMIGEQFPGMLDLTYNNTNQQKALGFDIIPLSAEELVNNADSFDDNVIGQFITDLSNTFNVSSEFTRIEIEESAKMALAFEKLQSDYNLDAVAMNFQTVVNAKAKTLPFLGACNLLKKGIGYAGESDVMSATLTAALSQISSKTTFTEIYSPDYQRNELLLSHMGECNYTLANNKLQIDLKPKPFNWGKCLRPAVPVFQMIPGKAILVSISETQDKHSFQLLAFECSVIETKVQPNLTVPYTKIKLNMDIRDFLVQYSKMGGTHHLSLIYNCDLHNIATLAELCQINFKTVGN
jgi:L-arabinose isomerase